MSKIKNKLKERFFKHAVCYTYILACLLFLFVFVQYFYDLFLNVVFEKKWMPLKKHLLGQGKVTQSAMET